MSSSNNRLCYLIPLHGRRSDLITGTVAKATKKVPLQVKVFVPKKETVKERSKRREKDRMRERLGEYSKGTA